MKDRREVVALYCHEVLSFVLFYQKALPINVL